MTDNSKILLTTLRERVSAKGNTYLVGDFGPARLVALKGEAGGETIWSLFIQAGKEDGGPSPQPAPAAPRRPPEATQARLDMPPPASRSRVQRVPKTARQVADAVQRPFYSDDIHDIGRAE
jgi:hypothetical protein